MPFAAGFNPEEAKELIAIIAVLLGPNPPLPVPQIPSFWEIVFDSPEIGAFENKWQLWRRKDISSRYAVIFRGTVTKESVKKSGVRPPEYENLGPFKWWQPEMSRISIRLTFPRKTARKINHLSGMLVEFPLFYHKSMTPAS